MPLKQADPSKAKNVGKERAGNCRKSWKLYFDYFGITSIN